MKENSQQNRPLIAVVGPCASGKSTLVRALRSRGYNAREVVQEHSYVLNMWQRVTQPDLLIYLDVSWKTAHRRRYTDASPKWWQELNQRLSHARRHANLYIDTDELTPQEVLEKTSTFLSKMLQD